MPRVHLDHLEIKVDLANKTVNLSAGSTPMEAAQGLFSADLPSLDLLEEVLLKVLDAVKGRSDAVVLNVSEGKHIQRDPSFSLSNVVNPSIPLVDAACEKPRTTPLYRIDPRVLIALDALGAEQRRTVSHVIADRERFLAYAADAHNVRTISEEESTCALSVPGGITIIYKAVGDEVEVLDVMGEPFLRRYGAKREPVGSNRSKSGTLRESR
jgi:hypothetical protein